ncbi:hypothetical protein T492DRAFT_910160 [Pavlovales sp. CCMP2436]|nr:hypothetical protein T492DRAFT_910160 [Pavlovales sp. CCMP2436]
MRPHVLSLVLLRAFGRGAGAPLRTRCSAARTAVRAFGPGGTPAPLRTRCSAACVAVRASDGEASLRAANLPTELERLASEEFDLLVVGGGATGAGVAMDAASRGLRVALVKGSDYTSGASSKSTKLIHGGLRYLAQAFQRKIPPRSLLDVFVNLRFDPGYLRIVAADMSERAWMIQSAPFMAKALPMMVPLFWVVGFLYDLIAGAGRGGAACVNYASIESLLFADGKGAGDVGARVCGARVLDRRSGKSVDFKATQVRFGTL